ncbi:MAG: TAXI family TRAP transporter solute-binding subunit [Alphaproteobacteria bacterium]|nr:TAXI family TRAP transporter solute-binding subunit [Alphaproteobacteria bacterium]
MLCSAIVVSPGETMVSGPGRRYRTPLAVVVIALGLIGRTASAEETRFFRIGAAATAGSFFEIGGVLASAISKPANSLPCEQGGSCGIPGLVAVAQATQGSVENLRMVISDQIESGIAQSDVVSWAYAGTGIFAGETPMRGLRAIASLFPESLHLVVPAAGSIETLADLKGKRISLGQPESGTLVDARLVLAAAGLGEKDLQPEYLRSGTAAANLADGMIEGFFLIGGVPIPAVRALAATTPVRLVPIGDEVFSKMQEKYGPYHRSIIPADTYPGVSVATSTVGFHALWVVSVDAPDDFIYEITKTLWNGATQRLLKAHDPIGRHVRLEDALAGLSVPLHPGAQRFYRDAGLFLNDNAPGSKP